MRQKGSVLLHLVRSEEGEGEGRGGGGEGEGQRKGRGSGAGEKWRAVEKGWGRVTEGVSSNLW